MPTDDDVRVITTLYGDGVGRLAGAFGLASVVLLGAAIVWAHHWGPLVYAIVGAWAITTSAAAVATLIAVRNRASLMRFVGAACVAISFGTLFVVSATYATGHDPSDLCGAG